VRRLATALLYAGVVGIVFGLSLIHGEYVGDYDFVQTSRFGWAIAYCLMLGIALYGLGLPDSYRDLRSVIGPAIGAAVVGALGVSLMQLVLGTALLPRYVIFGSAVLVVPWTVLCSKLSQTGRTRLEARDRVLVVGGRALASSLGDELDDRPERPASIVGSVELEDLLVEADGTPLGEAVARHGATVVVFEPDALLDERIVDQAAALHVTGVRIRTRPSFAGEWLGKVPVEDLARASLFFDIGELHVARYGRFKRVFDLVAGLVGVVVLVIVTPFVGLGDLVANRGPVFYRQTRVGRDHREFTIYKFRTMDDDHSAPTDWTAPGDTRITPFGNLLRRSHLDELPQMINVLKGDLSIVGPRPEQPRYVDELTAKLPFYALRHSVRPGLTGWAQVKYGYAGDETDAREKLQYDFYYLGHQSLRFDLVIAGRTIRTIVGGDGR
jgi:exopolysaccharide biosynthesis polyprenyl glycosylphosphotransferase